MLFLHGMALCLRLTSRLSSRCSLKALSTAAKSPPNPPPSLLTTDLRQHLSHLLGEYHDLKDQANTHTAVRDHALYQKMSSLEPLVKLTAHLEAKENEMTELQELVESCEEEGDMKDLARKEQKSCYKELQHIEVVFN